MTMAPTMDWTLLAKDPITRLSAVREYANRVFDDENRAATWLSRACRTVGGGLCAVGAACQNAEGFREAMAELARLERIEIDAHAAALAQGVTPKRAPAQSINL